ncbi:MAG: hypothetical protein A3E37_01130 [Candidatus Andersenbacteria bacterium RIFCSPHIGHO2_12_FULL_46_9]|nr:MAG: hypothetical protein A3B76_05725 [Candidatus Andersenbacteria bacterium RIFCSPHIGHO2_02_FULL_46_16]OGY37659.1 MAG: hypothetical protein A3E37_01130 [Candidatus Andersenbacteria bacterium RIFCSPHIGHO2_12_FULL_46_9]OGY38177.1 MAG: hypothetical protein A3G57_01190 [Candidatus Andersenbacteria bacterium RIFCSPLOWO2_12_FULL_45_8]HBE90331.1 hypothetical protein [Candidatus Andersenbacteria bacterium]
MLEAFNHFSIFRQKKSPPTHRSESSGVFGLLATSAGVDCVKRDAGKDDNDHRLFSLRTEQVAHRVKASDEQDERDDC